eukprot:384859-Rhodomonas_salina.2
MLSNSPRICSFQASTSSRSEGRRVNVLGDRVSFAEDGGILTGSAFASMLPQYHSRRRLTFIHALYSGSSALAQIRATHRRVMASPSSCCCIELQIRTTGTQQVQTMIDATTSQLGHIIGHILPKKKSEARMFRECVLGSQHSQTRMGGRSTAAAKSSQNPRIFVVDDIGRENVTQTAPANRILTKLRRQRKLNPPVSGMFAIMQKMCIIVVRPNILNISRFRLLE